MTTLAFPIGKFFTLPFFLKNTEILPPSSLLGMILFIVRFGYIAVFADDEGAW
jgi:hypothetical protein